jgi:hypothetical protein
MPQITIRLRRLLGELDYAQRRVLELRTGVAFTGPRDRSPGARRQVSELDSLWQLTGHADESAAACEL